MKWIFSCRRQIAFHETDMAGIIHFSNYFKWMEEAEHAFLRSLEIPFTEQNKMVFFGWPRVRASCKFSAPLRSGDTIEMSLAIKELTEKSVTYLFRFSKLGLMDPVFAAKGSMTTIYSRFEPEHASIQSEHIREDIYKKLKAQLG